MEPNDVSQNKERKPNPFAIASFVLATTPIIIYPLTITFIGMVLSEGLSSDVGGALWPVVLMLAVAPAIICLITDILAVIFGIIAISKRKTLFSWLGIIIVAVEALILAAI